jgi:2-amino-4-hydroxy-6-hydroxymethyldihydropteridine diphosphokinase
VIGLGGNLGDRRATLEGGIRAIADLPGVHLLGISSIWQTTPIGVPGGDTQPDFYNAALAARTALAPRDLLALLLAIEQRFGRVRSTPNAPRTLDLDLLWIEGVRLHEPGFELPHPRLHERAFALAPLLEVAGDAREPGSGTPYPLFLERVGLAGVKKLSHP